MSLSSYINFSVNSGSILLLRINWSTLLSISHGNLLTDLGSKSYQPLVPKGFPFYHKKQHLAALLIVCSPGKKIKPSFWADLSLFIVRTDLQNTYNDEPRTWGLECISSYSWSITLIKTGGPFLTGMISILAAVSLLTTYVTPISTVIHDSIRF